MTINWVLKKFDQLSPAELYAIMQLRNEVFVVEQDCVYQDADNKDQHSYHYMGWGNDLLIAYTRILPPGLSYIEPSIGRVVTSPSARGNGLGRELMERSITQALHLFGDQSIRIGAQLYLVGFYTSLGFQQTGDPYDEDGIKHVEMVKS
ncbi:MAG TPA: GNAT family N-acetyltransferase [Chitinophagaceae bacterium]|jgi:ElaA protein|nr:GNAT family N-acetyltransferase [Chitinophagaceae bacterium]